MTCAEWAAYVTARLTVAGMADIARDVDGLKPMKRATDLHRRPEPQRKRIKRLEIPPAGRIA